VTLSDADTVRSYKSLALVERAFRCVKTVDLHVRPVYHWLADRVRAHVLACSTNCSLFRRMEYWCRQDLRRLRVGTPIAFCDTRTSRETVVPSMPLAA
jgi:transposase